VERILASGQTAFRQKPRSEAVVKRISMTGRTAPKRFLPSGADRFFIFSRKAAKAQRTAKEE